MPIRPPSKVDIATLNPSPSLPRRFLAGTRQSSKKIEQDHAALMPIFRSGGARLKPGVFVGTRNAEIPLWPAALSVIAKRTIASAFGPTVIQFLDPLMTYSCPFFTAVVFCAAASEPAS